MHPDASFPVFMSGATSIASVVPYLAMDVSGIRHFVLAYVTFIALGMIHAFAIATTSSIVVPYHPVPLQEHKAPDMIAIIE